jgi:hypothetical protein
MLKNAEKAARQQMALDVERAQAMMPVQEMQLGMMQRQAEENAKIERSQMMQAALANALVEQQRLQAQQQAIATQAVFGGAG